MSSDRALTKFIATFWPEKTTAMVTVLDVTPADAECQRNGIARRRTRWHLHVDLVEFHETR